MIMAVIKHLRIRLNGTEILKLLNENAELKIVVKDYQDRIELLFQEIKDLKLENIQLAIIGMKQKDFIKSKGFDVQEVMDFARDGLND